MSGRLKILPKAIWPLSQGLSLGLLPLLFSHSKRSTEQPLRAKHLFG